MQRLPSSAPHMLRQQGVEEGLLPGCCRMGWRTEGRSGSSRKIHGGRSIEGGASPLGNARFLGERVRCGAAVAVPGKSVNGFDQHEEWVTAHFSDGTFAE